MSIGIYAFLRIYFLSFGLSAFAQFRTRSTPSSTLHSPDLPARSLVSSADRCSVSSVRARVVPCVVCPGSGTACAAGLCCAVVPGALGARAFTGGVYSRRPATPGQSFDHRKNKKGSKKSPLPPLSISKIPRKNKKTPTKGLCSVLYLPYKP